MGVAMRNETLLTKKVVGQVWAPMADSYLYFHSSKYLLKQIITHNDIFRILN